MEDGDLNLTSVLALSSAQRLLLFESSPPETLCALERLALAAGLPGLWRPAHWGCDVPGVRRRLRTDDKVVALTLDACGRFRPGGRPDGCDYRYVQYLLDHQIPATIFLSGCWMEQHPADFEALRREPLFDLQNHGTAHLPCSVTGQTAYRLAGTANLLELEREVNGAGAVLQQRTGRRPRFFRSGTAHYDELAVRFIEKLGYTVIGFDIIGDAGTSYTRPQVFEAVAAARPGSLIVLHMNQPKKECALGALEAFDRLIGEGFSFGRLADYELEVVGR